MITIGVRELRQHASKYLAMVRMGRTVQVTNRGRPVALLVPIPEGGAVERLGAEGRLTSSAGSLLALDSPLPPKPGEQLPSARLTEMRKDER